MSHSDRTLSQLSRPIGFGIEIDDRIFRGCRNLWSNEWLLGCFVTGIASFKAEAIFLLELRFILGANRVLHLLPRTVLERLQNGLQIDLSAGTVFSLGNDPHCPAK